MQIQKYKDLGVTMDASLKFKEHICDIAARAQRRVGLLFRCFLTRDVDTLVSAYTTYVRPVLEYASSIWSPSYLYLIDKLERVQRRFTKRIPGLDQMSYTERLAALGMDSLEIRRLRADLILAYKIIFGLIDVDCKKYFVLRVAGSTRGHDFKLIPEHCVVDRRKHFFSQRIVKMWNALPSAIIKFDSLSVFKSSLNKCDLRQFTVF